MKEHTLTELIRVQEEIERLLHRLNKLYSVFPSTYISLSAEELDHAWELVTNKIFELHKKGVF